MTTPQASPDLASLRVQIDNIDQQLLALLNQRALVAERVGEVKKREGSAYFRPDRVAQVIEKIKGANPGPLKPTHVAAIWREIMSACLALESPQRVAVLGPAGTFCEEAAIQYFGGAADLLYCNSFEEVFHATAAGSAQYGVVGIENSTEGVVTRSLDMLLHTPCHVVGEVSLLIRHNLLRTTNSAENIDVVVAHPQALAQCQAWLSKHLPHAERRPVESNAEGARLAALHPNWAGIASERAAQQFGLHVVAHAIQDEAYNRTRFAVICLPGTLTTPEPSGHDSTSLIISVPNRPGAVYDLLAPLKKHGVSMTRFESRPARTGKWEYYFYVDIEGHPAQPNVAQALAELQQLSAFYKLLGTYPTAAS
ncbi:prephenate dehydratase [Diaphorobacter aerolatus]|uniref:Bifunctional chorismate mutase/prephenate dehydratase n=1 Tax=Diaphorobacter aerolatus TaxID=1288495 RepID=A0A7H0GLU8_9BURK|nr:prephenate dehydratase [Diaphorobacter aerolatus]QNP49264.1 prephenate dehydratase [Diaphorobacter aerolatus]